MATPHDSLFRDTFGKTEHAVPLLRALLPSVLSNAIDWHSLQPFPEPQVDERQDTQQSDLLFTLRIAGRPALLYLLCEHKARPDRWTALQVVGYVVGIWKDLARRRPRPRHLPPVLPVVVSFGRRRWRASTDIHSLLDLRDLPAEVRTMLLAAMPQFAFAPHDFAARSTAEVRAMGLSLLGLWTVAAQQFVAPVGHDEDAAVRALVEWADVVRQLLTAPTGHEAAAALSSYILTTTRLSPKRLGWVFAQHIGDPSMKKFESTYDQITRAGKAEGKAEARVELLLRLITKRFGPPSPDTAARVHGAVPADLDRWTDRILDATTLDELFDG